VLVADGAADAGHPPRRAIRPAGAVFDAQIGGVAVGTGHEPAHALLVVGMHQGDERVGRATEAARLEPVQPLHVVRPDHQARSEVRFPGADAHGLERELHALARLAQRLLALLQTPPV
jgi:hypothetical protein